MPSSWTIRCPPCIISVILVRLVYITIIRPNANAIVRHQTELAAEGHPYVQQQSLYVVLKDYEQESCFVSCSGPSPS